jgi:D-sedoheptulose 7-phosphate isomerase
MAGPAASPKKLELHEFATKYKHTLHLALDSIDLGNVGKAIEVLAEARASDRTIFVCGNGGSASTASHFAADLAKGASFRRECRFRVHALTDSLPIITAYCNDVGYDSIFVEQLKNFAKPEDVLVAISASGNSPNVLRATEYANSVGCHTVALTGSDGGKLGPLSQVQIHVAGPHVGRTEDSHMAICHMISFYFIERT